MENTGNARLMRIFLSSTDKFRSTPLYEVIIFAAKRYQMSSAIVVKGIMGFNAGSNINTINFWDISERLPLIVEIIDTSEKTEKLLEIIKPYFEKLRNGCIVTTEVVDIAFIKMNR